MPGIRQRMQAEAEHGPEAHYEKIKSALALHLALQITWAFVSSAQAQSLAALACKDIEAVGGTPPRNLKALANIGCGGLYVFTPPNSSHMDPTTVALLQEPQNTAIGIGVQYHSLEVFPHLPHPQSADYSSYSNAWTWLVRSEWFKMPVAVDATDASEDDLQVNQEAEPMFHGTECGSALQICASGMFIGVSQE